MKYISVITTIHPPTKAVKEQKIPVIVIGDEKTPKGWECENCHYSDGNGLGFNYLPPVNHYARKNLGYLIAMREGADCIYDTDDDNCPNDNWTLRKMECVCDKLEGSGWVNVFDWLEFVIYGPWPRGLPLNKILQDYEPDVIESVSCFSPIHQGVSGIEADTDAVYRLTNGHTRSFKEKRSIYLTRNIWSPFNSQVSWWFKEAFPLLYLPQYATFRMTDIWRSFVAQRCLWEMGYGVVFHSPAEVIQERNPHDLMKDFEDEIPGYLHNDRIVKALEKLTLDGDVCYNMSECYKEMVRIGVLPKEELISLQQWITDIRTILG